jgi:ribosomal protein S6--L-glutamate ligase
MTISIGVLTVKGKDYHPTKRLAEAAAGRGAEILPVNPYDVQPAYAQGRPVLHGQPDASHVKAVLPRQGAEIKTACLPLIAHFEQMNIPVINGLRSILMARNKFFMLQAMTRAGLSVPNTIYAASVDGCNQARKYFAPHGVVLKPINGHQGTGLHCLTPQDDLPGDARARITAGRGMLVQEYFPPRQRQDLRVLVIGKSVAGAIRLKPPDGDFRTNVHVGGQTASFNLDDDTARLALRAARATALEIAGVDLILPDNGAPMVIEVNSAPGFRAMEATTGKDVAGLMMDYVLSVCSKT